MSNPLRRIAERFIDSFRESGGLDNLPGAGKPLPMRSTNAHQDAVEEIGNKIMKDSGALPPEVVMRQELAKARETLKNTTDPEARRAAQLRVADLELRTNLALEARMPRR